MSGLSDQIVYFLIVGLILLARYLWQQRTRIRPWEDALSRGSPEAAPAPPSAPAGAKRPARLAPEQPGSPWLPEGERPAPSPAPRPRTNPMLLRAAPVPRRFTRSALFGTRRRAQDAVVAATILGPCRAMSPDDSRR